MNTFQPKHAHPVTLFELSKLEPELLTAEITRLQHSIQHLERSNQELIDFTTSDEADDEDKQDFIDSIKENEEVIASQKERLHMIRLALSSKLGVDAANSHYNLAASATVPTPLAPPADLPTPATAVERVSTGPRWADDEVAEEAAQGATIAATPASVRVASTGATAAEPSEPQQAEEGLYL